MDNCIRPVKATVISCNEVYFYRHCSVVHATIKSNQTAPDCRHLLILVTTYCRYLSTCAVCVHACVRVVSSLTRVNVLLTTTQWVYVSGRRYHHDHWSYWEIVRPDDSRQSNQNNYTYIYHWCRTWRTTCLKDVLSEMWNIRRHPMANMAARCRLYR